MRGLPNVLWSEFWNNNPLSQPPSERTAWTKDLEVPIYQRDAHELLFYVGCTPAYDRRAQLITKSIVRLLHAAKVPFGILGEEEPCCGEAVLSFGHTAYFQELASQAAGTFRDHQVAELMTVSPHCQSVFHTRYPDCGAEFNPIHYTGYLKMLVEQGRLTLSNPFPHKVTVHDPCILARKGEDCQSIRFLLEQVPELELIEMEHILGDTICCGGGGGRMWMETPPEERFADIRLKEAAQTGAEILATACPYCIACLEDSVKSMGLKDLVVMDVAEILAQAL